MNLRISQAILLLTTLLLCPSLFLAGDIETVAGTGEKGYMSDTSSPHDLAIKSNLNNPFGVIVGLDGDIWFCDTGNHVIRRISRKSGRIATIVGTGKKGYTGNGGPPELADCFEPYELRFHPNGDLYWVEMQNHIVRRLNAESNAVELVAGSGKSGFSGDDGPAAEASLHRPHSIQFDQKGERLFICDIGNHRIRVVDLDTGVIRTWCGNGKKGMTANGAPVSPETPLNGPRALDRGPNGDLWLALREGNAVFRIDMKKEQLFHVAGTGKKGFHSEDRPALESELSGPKGVAISPDGNQIYLADTESHSVRAIDLSAPSKPMLRLVAGTGKRGDGPDTPDPLLCKMARLHGVGADPVNGDLYIGDSETHKIRVIRGLPHSPRKKLKAYQTDEFKIGDRACRVTKPDQDAAGKPWIWRCRFYGAFPAADEALLAQGWHVAWIDVANHFGGPIAMDAFELFYQEIQQRYKLSKKSVMEGFSRGGLPALNWSILHPERVAGIYLDAAVSNIHTWPKSSSPQLYERCLQEYGLTLETAEKWESPLIRIAPLLEKKVPLLVVAGTADAVVPFDQNTGLIVNAYRQAKAPVTVILKPACDHHPHSLYDPTPIEDWARDLVGK